MNCNELAQWLDERELEELAPATRSRAVQHLSACQDCARDHALHLRLAALPVPALPPSTLAVWRSVAVAAQPGQRNARRSRLIAGGALTAAAAAAAVLLLQPDLRAGRAAQVTASAPAGNSGVDAPTASTAATPASSQEVTAPSEDTAPLPPARRFTVHVMPTTYDTADAAQRAAGDEFVAALLDGLRGIPGLVLSGPDASIDPASLEHDFVLAPAIRPGGHLDLGHGTKADWEATLRLRVNDGGRSRVQPIATGGTFRNEPCMTPELAAVLDVAPCEPADMAAQIVKTLRLTQFPVDAALQARLLAEVRDPGARQVSRMNALDSLITLSRREQGGRSMIQPLAAIARESANEAVQLEIVTLLATTFSREPEGRAALEQLARSSADSLVARVAERALTDGSRWRSYALATTLDTTLPLSKRLAPLQWMAGAKAQGDLGAVAGALLENHGDMLVDLLSRTGHDPEQRQVDEILHALQTVDHPAAVDFWLTSYDRVPDQLRVAGLLAHRNDPRVRRRLEEILTTHPDEHVRGLVSGGLREGQKAEHHQF